MSKIDYQALREAAEKATKGKWAVEFDDEIYSTDGINHEQIAMVFSENESRDAEFIAAANPATVLALLDERERNQQYIKRRDQENEDIALTVGKLRVELEAAKSKLNEQREYYEGVISDGCKRIAELEAREVQLPTRYDLRYGHPINADERQVMIPKENGSWLYLIDLEHALRVADIRIKGE
ncbi:ead/Ea22-like family protein [Shigella dysenteriae]|uniref:Bacteriophage protein n=2 Tax=Shigella dysenteriae TaxID=622 RepID=A0A2S8DEN6_SHIDY|nr:MULTISPECIES: ead/Ea22-like family protein [Shigella]EFV9745251.1 ead/Ea22-like family protein [Shigella flexneri]EFY9108300.1 ead/Ea22-like family protein [Shigella sonnei]EJY6561776.1 ead/Ea22-like family protein [Escherichia coli]EFP7661207.1 ead/Ea22-like family protein [Shigella dysenteriae]EFP8351756.1 ead/Ea22-like family protein [Shigella dysenteriae]